MKEVKYIDQSHEVLNLALVNGEVDLGPLHILDEKEIDFNGITLRFGVLGASHFVSFPFQNSRFYEIFSCADTATLTSKEFSMHVFTLETLQKESLTQTLFEKIEYEITTEVMTGVEGKEKLSTLLELSTTDTTNTCRFDFPMPQEYNFLSTTVVSVAVINISSIKINSVHTYPNEDRQVYTESIITLKNS